MPRSESEVQVRVGSGKSPGSVQRQDSARTLSNTTSKYFYKSRENPPFEPFDQGAPGPVPVVARWRRGVMAVFASGELARAGVEETKGRWWVGSTWEEEREEAKRKSSSAEDTDDDDGGKPKPGALTGGAARGSATRLLTDASSDMVGGVPHAATRVSTPKH